MSINRADVNTRIVSAASKLEKIAVALEHVASSAQPTGTDPYAITLGNAEEAEKVRAILVNTFKMACTRTGASLSGIT
jgi:hypothetical protein